MDHYIQYKKSRSQSADKNRSYSLQPPSSLAMSMYSDPKYLDSTPKTYGYLDPAFTKAYFENKMYSSDISPRSHGYSALDLGKLYDQPPTTSAETARSPTQTPEERPEREHEPSSASSTSSTSPGGFPYYQSSGLIPVSQYPVPYHQPSASQPSPDFRRPLTVIF